MEEQNKKTEKVKELAAKFTGKVTLEHNLEQLLAEAMNTDLAAELRDELNRKDVLCRELEQSNIYYQDRVKKLEDAVAQGASLLRTALDDRGE